MRIIAQEHCFVYLSDKFQIEFPAEKEYILSKREEVMYTENIIYDFARIGGINLIY